jgi:hypothetical protein
MMAAVEMIVRFLFTTAVLAMFMSPFLDGLYAGLLLLLACAGGTMTDGSWNMNRIGKLGKRERATDKVSGQPESCSFCGEKIGEEFVALSLDVKSAMCAPCVSRFSITSRLRFIREAYGDPGKEADIMALVRRAIAGESSSEPSKRAIVSLVSRLVRRSASLLSGWKASDASDPVSGVSLAPLRVALSFDDASTTLVAACLAAGLPAVKTPLAECLSGNAWRRLSRMCMNDRLMIDHGLMVVSGGCVTSEYNCSMAFVGARNIPSGMEVIDVSGHATDAN